MKTLHEKSPCCRGNTRRFGKRRRQCSVCKKTWRRWRKKRGRKVMRLAPQYITAYFTHRSRTVRAYADGRSKSKSCVQRRLAHSLTAFVAAQENAWRAIMPEQGELILIADALWHRIRKEKYAIYIMLLRPKHGSDAVIVPPQLIAGHEDAAGWQQALHAIPPAVRMRIGALVCDGGTGVVSLAHRNGWLLQRCHFHVLSAVQNYLTTGPRSKNRPFAKRVMREVQRVLTASTEVAARDSLARLAVIRDETRSRGVRRVLGGLLINWREYRAYLVRPEWSLPTTSNTAESFIQCVRDLMYRCRGFRTKEKCITWITALAAHKKTIRCNGKNQPN